MISSLFHHSIPKSLKPALEKKQSGAKPRPKLAITSQKNGISCDVYADDFSYKRSLQCLQPPTPQSFLNPLLLRPSKVAFVMGPKSGRVEVRGSLKEKAVAGLTAAALTASIVVPDVASVAGPDLSSSLQNFLLSVTAGGVVLTAIFGALIGVSNFDPVKRG